MADGKTLLALAAAAAAFGVGALVASGLSTDATSGPGGDLSDASPPTTQGLPPVGDYANSWHLQTAVAAYESRLLRYAQQDDDYAGARFAFHERVFLLYGAGRPSAIVRNLIQSAPPEVDARWIRVAYSARELRLAQRKLVRAMPARSVVEFAPNYSGILIGLHPLPRTPRSLEGLYALAERLTDVPVTFLEAGFSNPL